MYRLLLCLLFFISCDTVMVLFFNSYHNVTLTAFSFSLRNVQYCPDEGWLYIKLKRRRR